MRVAIIDLGTNSVRFDVHTLTAKGSATLLHREKLMIRLGQGVFLKGKMDPAAIERAVEAMEHFQKIAANLRVRKIVAFGTSALREAEDSQLLVDRVLATTGIEIKVISGLEEAKLIAQGVLVNEAVPKGKFALVDIGGGSTEVSICRGKKVHAGESFPLGTARLQQVFLKRSPPREGAIAELRDYIGNLVRQKIEADDWFSCDTIVGSSGTVRALARILSKKGGAFSLKDLSRFVAEMSKMNTTQLLEIPTMEAKRVDMILAGAILLEEIAKALGVKKIVPSEFSLRDGIIEEEVRLAKSQMSSLLELHLDDLFAHATRFGFTRAHVEHIADLTTQVFDRLRSVHGLDPRWKIYLISTMILRNCGQVISYGGRERHSYYIVKHLDFPSMETWEREFIAELCLGIPAGKVEQKTLQRISSDSRKRQAFVKLLALARFAHCLDLGPNTVLKIRRVQVAPKFVKIGFDGKSTAGIEQLLIERKKKLFEDVFRRQLILESTKK